MKRETLRHPKTYDLAARLNVSRAEALGFLTLLWDFTAEVATQGNIGKWPDGAIAGSCDWRGDPSSFIESLVGAGWIDRSHDHRLIVHDWPDHCERWVKAKLDKLGQSFLECYLAGGDPQSDVGDPRPERSTVASVVGSVEASPPRDRTEPNLPEPNLPEPAAKPARRIGVLTNLKSLEKQDLVETGSVVAVWRLLSSGKNPIVPPTEEGRLFVVAIAMRSLEHGKNPPALFQSLLRDRRAQEKVESYKQLASQRLREFDCGASGDSTPLVQTLADRLGWST